MLFTSSSPDPVKGVSFLQSGQVSDVIFLLIDCGKNLIDCINIRIINDFKYYHLYTLDAEGVEANEKFGCVRFLVVFIEADAASEIIL